MKVAVLGGGPAGLATGLRLLQQGVDVTLFERAGTLGGLAGSFDFDGLRVEKYYHFICAGDDGIVALAGELGLQIRWKATRTSFFHEGRHYGFSSALDLLRFGPVPFIGRIRFGLHILRAKYTEDWRRVDDETAVNWLKHQIGEAAYQVIWHPLLSVKFGHYYEQISAAWIWHRVHRVAIGRRHPLDKEKYGHIVGGTDRLIGGMEAQIRRLGGAIQTNAAVEQILAEDMRAVGVRVSGTDLPFDAVVSAVPLPVYIQLLPESCGDYRRQLQDIEYLGIACMILKVRHPITHSFWLNINDSRIAFNGIIEYSNLTGPDYYEGHSIIYVPFYLPPDAGRFAYSDEQMFEEYVKALKLVNPDFERDWILGYRVFKDRFAQAVCKVGFGQRIPLPAAPIRGLYLLDSTQLYPSDRTISGMIELANRVSAQIGGDLVSHGRSAAR
jgi:protoporphyrinogen oxidase